MGGRCDGKKEDQESSQMTYIRRSWIDGFVEECKRKSARPGNLLEEGRLSFLRTHIYGVGGGNRRCSGRARVRELFGFAVPQ
jgi:hypothetical protein